MVWKKIILITLATLFFGIGVFMSYIPAEQFIEIGSIISIIMISFPAFYGMIKIFRNKGLISIVALGLFALIIETIGIHTGFPYSTFEYTMSFGYRLFGTTPWTVFIAWSPLVIGSFLLANTGFNKKWSKFLIYIGILVITDIILDPAAVARGLWKYSADGIWFDVPLQNFLGWTISGTIAYMLLQIILGNKEIYSTQYKYIWIGKLSLMLSIFLWTGVNFGYQLWLPAILGIILGKILIFRFINSNKK